MAWISEIGWDIKTGNAVFGVRDTAGQCRDLARWRPDHRPAHRAGRYARLDLGESAFYWWRFQGANFALTDDDIAVSHGGAGFPHGVEFPQGVVGHMKCRFRRLGRRPVDQGQRRWLCSLREGKGRAGHHRFHGVGRRPELVVHLAVPTGCGARAPILPKGSPRGHSTTEVRSPFILATKVPAARGCRLIRGRYCGAVAVPEWPPRLRRGTPGSAGPSHDGGTDRLWFAAWRNWAQQRARGFRTALSPTSILAVAGGYRSMTPATSATPSRANQVAFEDDAARDRRASGSSTPPRGSRSCPSGSSPTSCSPREIRAPRRRSGPRFPVS